MSHTTTLSAVAKLAQEIGQSERTIQRYLRERDPNHSGWWRPTEAEYEAAKAELSTPSERRRGGKRFRRK